MGKSTRRRGFGEVRRKEILGGIRMENLFKEINIQSSFNYCSWSFQYKGEAYINIVSTKRTTEKSQIIVIKDMVKQMEGLIKK